MRRSLPVALALHAALLALAWRTTPRADRTEVRAVSLEPIDLDPSLDDEPAQGATAALASRSEVSEPAQTAHTTGRSGARVAISGASLAEDEGARATGDGAPEGDVHAWERPSRGALGIPTYGSGADKGAFYNYRGEGDATGARAASETSTRDLRQALLDRDKGLGLGAEGPVITALESAGYAGALPSNEARCVLDVTVGPDGEVVAIGVDEVSSDRALWERFAKDALALVKGKRARVPAGSKGVALRIEVSSRVQLPSGHSPSTDVSVLGLPAKKGEGKDPVRVSILNPLPKLTSIPLDRDGKIQLQIPMLSVEVFGTNADPTDLSMKVRRVIGAKVLSERLL